MSVFDYDLFVIGGGSGGVRASRMAALAGARVALAEEWRMGGTCVIRGCIPKKLLVYASQFSENVKDAAGYGWDFGEARFDWPTLIANKDKEIARLEGLYTANVQKAGVTIFQDRAVFEDPHTLLLLNSGKRVTAEKILIATGNRPTREMGTSHVIPGGDLCITSDEAFHLKELAQAHPDRRRRLYRAGIRPHLPRPGQQRVAGLSRRQAAARLRRGHARRAVRFDEAARAGSVAGLRIHQGGKARRLPACRNQQGRGDRMRPDHAGHRPHAQHHGAACREGRASNWASAAK